MKRYWHAACAAILSGLVGCGGGGSSAGTSNPASGSAPAISTQPLNATVAAGAGATFSVTATGSAPLSYQWQKNGTAIAGATAASYTTPATSNTDNGAQFTVTVSNSAGSVTSNPAVLSVTSGPGTGATGTDVTTFKNDNLRTGQNLAETVLTPANVNSASFGLLKTLSVDGKVDAQPLYLSQLTLGTATHNVVFVATEHGSVYAFDADSYAQLWQVSLLATGETPSDNHGCSQVVPEIGITATPVIDRKMGPHGALYVVAMSIDKSANYHQRLHALDVTTGAELLGGPIEISATYTAGTSTTTFAPGMYEERAALLLVSGSLYTAWTSHCDAAPYQGWVMQFNASNLAQTGTLNVGPGASGSGFANQGPGIWMSGDGPAADAAGNIYLLTGNGPFETTLNGAGFPSGGDYGNSFLRITSGSGGLAVADYFAMSNEVAESGADRDLGSGGEMLLPDVTDGSGGVHHLVVGAGKDQNIYVVDRDNMGKYSATANNIWQQLNGAAGGGVFSSPAYFNNSVYYAGAGATLRAFALSNAKLSSSPASQSSASFGYPGTSPAISANGSSNGIVWAHENSSPAVLHAYDASNLAHELYNSSQATGSRDHFGAGNKFITPMINNGKVFVGTTNSVAIFGLLH